MQGGQPGALMQVFLGLPWALTAATARVARNDLRMRRSAQSRRQADDVAAREAALEPVRAELIAAQAQLARLEASSPRVSPADADLRLAAFAGALTRQRDAHGRLVVARAAVEFTQADIDDEVKRLQALEQSRLVRPLLGRLTPSVCPRCRTGIDEGRVRREEDDHQCSVCAEPLADDEKDEEELDAVKAAVARAEEERAQAGAELIDAEREGHAAAQALAEAEAAVRELEDRRPAESETRDLERQIARLQGRLEQHVFVQPADDAELGTVYDVVEAARQEAEERRSEAASDLLEELGLEIVELARAFGIANLERARPTLAAQLRLDIGGSSSSFSGRTGGERLRLRLATVIALLRVGERRGVGRHPGLLLIDSPGGEEMVEENVAAILRELASVCEQMPELQLICATAHAAEVQGVLPPERIIHGPDYTEVW